MDTTVLQVRETKETPYKLFREPKFFGKLEGGSTLMVVSYSGDCYFFEVSKLDGYKTFDIDGEDERYTLID